MHSTTEDSFLYEYDVNNNNNNILFAQTWNVIIWFQHALYSTSSWFFCIIVFNKYKFSDNILSQYSYTKVYIAKEDSYRNSQERPPYILDKGVNLGLEMITSSDPNRVNIKEFDLYETLTSVYLHNDTGPSTPINSLTTSSTHLLSKDEVSLWLRYTLRIFSFIVYDQNFYHHIHLHTILPLTFYVYIQASMF